MLFRFADLELDADLCELRRGNEILTTKPKVVDLLLFLVRHRDRVVTRGELLEALWPGVVVGDQALSQTIYEARKVLLDDATRQRVIQTVRQRGFRFAADVEEVDEQEPTGAEIQPESPEQEVSADSSFIGREDLMVTLRSAFEEARAGRGRLVLLAGEAGIGKSRVASEFDEWTREQGAHVLSAWCYEGDGAPPFWPWTQILRTLVDLLEPDELKRCLAEGAELVSSLAPSLRTKLPSLPDPEPPAEGDARFQLFDAVTRCLRRMATSRPLVLILDDLHWADPASLMLLEFLLHEVRDSRLVVLGTYRPDDVRGSALAELLGKLLAQPGCERMFVRNLSREQVACFLKHQVDEATACAWAERLFEKTDGNPFFLTEMVRLLKADGRMTEPEPSRLPLPLSIKEVIRRRLVKLSPESQRALSIASVIGREFELELVRRMWNEDVPFQLEWLDEAVASGILIETHGGLARFRFAHDPIRESLYTDIAKAERARLHRRAAEALEALHAVDHDERLGQLARHLFETLNDAGDPEHALSRTQLAAERAQQRKAFEEAAEHYERALRALDLLERSDPALRGELLVAYGEALRRAGDMAESREQLAQGAEVARSLGDGKLLARAALSVGYTLPESFQVGRVDELQVGLLQEALSELDDEEIELRARVATRLSFALFWSHEVERRAALAELAVDLSHKAADPVAIALALAARDLAQTWPQTRGEAAGELSRIMEIAKANGDLDLVWHCHFSRLGEILEQGDGSMLEGEISEIARLAERTREPHKLWGASLVKAMQALLMGQHTEAEQLIFDSYGMGECAQDPAAFHAFALLLAQLRFDQGRLSELVPTTRRLAHEFAHVPSWRCGLALYYAQTGRQDEARREFEWLAADRFERLGRDLYWVGGAAILSRLCRRLGDVQRAAQLYELLEPWAGRNIVIGPVGFLGPASLYLGLLSATQRKLPEAALHFENALELSRRMGSPSWLARTQLEYARVLLELGDLQDGKRAQELLKAAYAVARDLGLAMVLEDAKTLLDEPV